QCKSKARPRPPHASCRADQGRHARLPDQKQLDPARRSARRSVPKMMTTPSRTAAAVVPLAVLLPLMTLASLARAAVPVPTIEGPITSPGGAFLQSTTFD